MSLHCWENGPSFCRETGEEILNEFGICEEHYFYDPPCEVGSTCMLDQGHKCPHEWTRDDKIGVTFTK
jgi:hypothetical protein